MLKHDVAPPNPEVQYLPAIFRRIDSGEIVIPAFQRKFVWSEAQIIELLESVYRGYPVGSVLFWKVESPTLLIEHGQNTTFPTVSEKYPLFFILDGMQRLSSLYGVFHREPKSGNAFSFYFDLKDEKFLHFDPESTKSRSKAGSSDIKDTWIRLSDLFSPRALLDTQRRLAELDEADELIDRSVKLFSIFQEYLIPTVTIARTELTEVVEIFERINSTGTRLNAVDFMRALTWSREFDLGNEIEKLKSYLEQYDFEFPAETLVKVVAVMVGSDPSAAGMLELKKCSPEQLQSAVQDAKVTLVNVINFLKGQLRIMSYDFVPYEGQLLVLVKLFASTTSHDDEVTREIMRWFWSISFSEGLRGRPDTYVSGYISAADRLVHGEIGALHRRLDLAADDFVDRRFMKGRALSAAVASMFAIKGARSLVTGQLIDPGFYMREFSSENFVGLYSLNEVRDAVNPNLPSARTFSNVVVATELDVRIISESSPSALANKMSSQFSGSEVSEILESQAISDTAFQYLLEDKPRDFFSARAHSLYEAAQSLAR